MGLLIDGVWHNRWYDTSETGGAFQRQDSRFRDTVTADGSSGFRAEPGRYHLYVSLACPWAHRTLVFRALKKLENAISVSVVEPLMGSEGWTLGAEPGSAEPGGAEPGGAEPGGAAPGSTPDTVNGARRLHEIYTAANPTYTGRVTVPVLWDKRSGTIVNNESAEIIRMLNSAFDAWGDGSLDFYPEPLRGEIDALNAEIYETVNNGVYRAGFATAQTPYEEAFDVLFATLDGLEKRLSTRRYLCGDAITEADWRLFTTLVRFDAVYYGHFKCNRRRIADYPNLWGYLRDLYAVPGVAGTVNMDHIKTHYYASHRTINPTGIVPKGPDIDFAAPHARDRGVRVA